jgi:hypothetical protein
MIILAAEIAKDAAELATGVGGVAGSIIAILMGVVTILAGVIVYMQKRADKIYGYRLTERDTLKDSLHEAATAITSQASATRERNVIMDELAQTIRESTQATALLVERLTVQHAHLLTDQDRTGSVIASIADAMRNAALQTSGVKQSVDLLVAGVPGITTELKAHITRALEDVQTATKRAR